jgi:mRNA-degrading endonuclease RelE of RelBE toxin-antitoxin system
MHYAIGRFWKCFKKLPDPVQKISKRNFQLLKINPLHPSLHFKKVGKFWSVRIGLDYRALAVEDGEDFVWVWIGTHDEYEKMITGRD